MSSTDIKIGAKDLKNYISSSRSVSFSEYGCKLTPKSGRVCFFLSEFPDVQEISLHIKRISGNGIATILSGERSKEITVSSKNGQIFDIPIDNNKFEIFRPGSSVGELYLTGLSFKTNDTTNDETRMNWKNIIRSCGKHGGIRLVGGRLFASIGGFIEYGNLIREINTNPSNMAIRDKDKIKFQGSCEITNISLHDGAVQVNRASTEIFTAREPPTVVNMPQPHEYEDRVKIPNGNEILFKHIESQLQNIGDNIVYDSAHIKNFQSFVPNKSKLAKHVRSNNSCYLVIRVGSQINATIANLEPNKEYICIFNGKVLSGNGKLCCGLSIDDFYKGEWGEVIFGNNFSLKHVVVRTGSSLPNAMQRLHLAMPDKLCNGELLIERILIINGLGLEHKLNIPRPSTPQTTTKLLSAYNVYVDGEDHVLANSKKFAYYTPTIASHNINDLAGNILSNSVSGVMWANKVKSVLHNLNIDPNNNDFNSLYTGPISNIKHAKKLWIEPFDINVSLKENDLYAFNIAESIFSPSFSNVEFLKSKFEQKDIRLMSRPLPWVMPEPEPLFTQFEYVLAFERDRKTINVLLDAWSDKMPKLVVVGARGKYPNFVYPINEYYPYNKLLFLISNAKFIIDLPNNCDYYSAFLDLICHMGKPILSSNWFAMNKKNCAFILNNNLNQIKLGLEQIANIQPQENLINEYNNYFINKIHALF